MNMDFKPYFIWSQTLGFLEKKYFHDQKTEKKNTQASYGLGFGAIYEWFIIIYWLLTKIIIIIIFWLDQKMIYNYLSAIWQHIKCGLTKKNHI